MHSSEECHRHQTSRPNLSQYINFNGALSQRSTHPYLKKRRVQTIISQMSLFGLLLDVLFYGLTCAFHQPSHTHHLYFCSFYYLWMSNNTHGMRRGFL